VGTEEQDLVLEHSSTVNGLRYPRWIEQEDAAEL
jgi:hypothetical protein